MWNYHFFPFCGSGEGKENYTVELYRKFRLARSDGMRQRELARHFNISRDSVRKMLAFSCAARIAAHEGDQASEA